jgi:RNA polymerase primary sigma factor
VKKVKEYLALVPEVCSLDAPAGEEEDGSLQMLLEDLQAPQPQEALIRKELEHTMDALLSQLPERQQRVLRLRFGMEDDTCYSLEAIGKKMNVTKERARQIERQAMEKLQQLGTGLGLEDFLQ